jgi:SAM-dependent methyltransferase
MESAQPGKHPSRPEGVPAHDPLSWSRLYRYRKAAAARWGRIYDLPLARRPRDLVVAHTVPGQQVLEVGAGEKRIRGHLVAAHGRIDYFSLDIDRDEPHDFYHLDEVHQTFDRVLALEVAEHLEWAELRPWLAGLRRTLREDGLLILSTPNTYYPPAYLRDATHRTPLCYDELAGLVESVGLDVIGIYRIYNDPLHRKLLRRYLLGWLFRTLGLDFARQIVLVARRTPRRVWPEENTPGTENRPGTEIGSASRDVG